MSKSRQSVLDIKSMVLGGVLVALACTFGASEIPAQGEVERLVLSREGKKIVLTVEPEEGMLEITNCRRSAAFWFDLAEGAIYYANSEEGKTASLKSAGRLNLGLNINFDFSSWFAAERPLTEDQANIESALYSSSSYHTTGSLPLDYEYPDLDFTLDLGEQGTNVLGGRTFLYSP